MRRCLFARWVGATRTCLSVRVTPSLWNNSRGTTLTDQGALSQEDGKDALSACISSMGTHPTPSLASASGPRGLDSLRCLPPRLSLGRTPPLTSCRTPPLTSCAPFTLQPLLPARPSFPVSDAAPLRYDPSRGNTRLSPSFVGAQ